MPELLRLFFRSEFGLKTKTLAPKNRSYRYGDFIMQNGDYPLPKLRGVITTLEFTSRNGKQATFVFGKEKEPLVFLISMTPWIRGNDYSLTC